MSYFVTPEVIEQALNWRAAVKKFDPQRVIPDEIWHTIEESFRLAPSSYGLQPWHFILVQDRSLRENLWKHSYRQNQVLECSHYVVLCYQKMLTISDCQQFVKEWAKVKKIPESVAQGFEKNLVQDISSRPPESIAIWNSRQVYIAMGMALLTAALLGVDACPMEGIEPGAYDRILGLGETPWTAVAAVAFGYRQVDDPVLQSPKFRYPTEKVWEKK